MYKRQEDTDIKFEKSDKMAGFWGSAYFGKKENYFEIPNEIKVDVYKRQVDDIASRLGVIIRALDEELSKNYSGLAYADVQQDLITFTIIKVSLLIDNVLPKYMN